MKITPPICNLFAILALTTVLAHAEVQLFQDTSNFRAAGWTISQNVYNGGFSQAGTIWWDNYGQSPNTATKIIQLPTAAIGRPLTLRFRHSVSNNRLEASVNGQLLSVVQNNNSTDAIVWTNVALQLPTINSPINQVTIRFWTDDVYAYWNHTHLDNISLSYTPQPFTPQITALPNHQHNPSVGPQVLQDFHFTSEQTCKFTFSTNDVGRMCLIAWSRNLKEWFPLVQFNTGKEGTKVEDLPENPEKFYKAVYLPDGVTAARSFAYPIGIGIVDEQIDPPRNNFYLAPSVTAPYERGAISPNTANWYNFQDVGSYYSTGGGLHGGEDWNIRGGDSDKGEEIRAIANGQVIDIRPAHSAGPSHSGFAMLVRHWLLNGDTVDSLYVHLAPDKSGGVANTGGVFGSESDFSFQEGAAVSKGDVIGVIGAVTSPAMTPHLHLEIRTKQANPSNLWPNDTGDGYYGPVPGTAGNRSPSITSAEVQAAFLLMQKDGIIDPSDFIDDHQ